MAEFPLPRAAAASRLDSMGMGNAGAPPAGAGLKPFAEVHYRAAETPEMSCGGCVHFDGEAACDLVAGNIDAQGTCDLFEPAPATPAVPAAQPSPPPMQGA